MRQERRPTGLGYISSPSAHSNTKRKKVKPEGNDYLQNTHHNWTKANELQRPCLNKTRKQIKGGSRPCEYCALCGCYGKNNKSMAPNVSQLLTKTKTFKLTQSLTCADFGIYVATFVICHEQYVGQTSNKFSKRWSAHRNNWNKQDCKTDSDKDQMALSRDYSENHGTTKQATSARSIHRCFCRTTKLSLSGYL